MSEYSLMGSQIRTHTKDIRQSTDQTVMPDEYDLLRMQVVDEIARLLQSKHPTGWEIDAQVALKHLEQLVNGWFVDAYMKHADRWKPAKNKAYAAKMAMKESLYFWDIFTVREYAGLRLHVIQKIKNEETMDIHRMLRELKNMRIAEISK